MSDDVDVDDDDEVSRIILRSYPKAIFFYPLFLTSLILGLVAYISGANPYFDRIWMFVFFLNLFVISFETNSGKMFVIILFVIGLGFLIGLVILPSIRESNSTVLADFLTYGLTHRFYFTITLAFAIIFVIILIGVKFDYWIIEKNEVMHTKGLFANVKRYPTSNMRYYKEIRCIFEYLIFRSGTLTIFLDKNSVYNLENVPKINKIAEELDRMLSQIRVKMVK